MTLTEVVISVPLFVMVMVGSYSIVLTCMHSWRRAEMFARVSYMTGQAIEKMIYGSESHGGLREAENGTVVSGTNGWTLSYLDADDIVQTYAYDQAQQTITYTPQSQLVCEHVVFASAVPDATGDGVTLRVDVMLTEGRYSSSNSMTTFVEFRNH